MEKEYSFTKIKSENESPSSRCYHQSFYYNNCIYIYGGYTDNAEKNNDFFKFDLKKKKWKKLENIEVEKSSNPSITLHKNRLIFLNDSKIYSYDLDEEFLRIHTKKNFNHSCKHEFKKGHECVVINNFLYMFGGQKDGSTFTNDIYKLDLKLYTWSKQSVYGTQPPKTEGFSLTLDPKTNEMYVFGGFNNDGTYESLYKFKGKWSKLKDNPFGNRCGHSSFFHEDKLYIYGGYMEGIKPKRKNTIECYDTKSDSWSKIKTKNNPLPTAYQSLTYFKGSIYIFGGYDGKLHSEFNSLELSKGKLVINNDLVDSGENKDVLNYFLDEVNKLSNENIKLVSELKDCKDEIKKLKEFYNSRNDKLKIIFKQLHDSETLSDKIMNQFIKMNKSLKDYKD